MLNSSELKRLIHGMLSMALLMHASMVVAQTTESESDELCCDASASIYSLTIEASAPAVVEGTLYRFYVNALDSNDRISAVYGNDVDPLVINTPNGIFNSPFNPSWNASGIHPLFFDFVPDLVDDSYATINLDVMASEIGGATDPSLSEDVALSTPISVYFMSGGTQLNVNTLAGGAWYVLNNAVNAMPFNNRWLIGQITTTGEISGRINFQVQPSGVVDDYEEISVEFNGSGTFYPIGSDIGCTDPSACDYNPLATIDSGICNYVDPCGICGGNGIAGCLEQEACNYSASATCDDGSCEYFSCASLGCTDSGACNYNVNAIYEDGSCTYPDAVGVCGGTCDADNNGNGVCDDNEVNGCTDSMACNFDGAATVDDGSCIPDNDEDGICDDVDDCVGAHDDCGVCNGPGAIYECECADLPDGDCDCDGNQLDALGVCGGDCVADADGDGLCDDVDDCVGTYDVCGVCNGAGAIYDCGCEDTPDGDCDCDGNQLDALGVCGGVCAGDANSNGICDADEIEGCTDSEALNFYDAANVDDGSCILAVDLPAGWDFTATPMSAVFLGNVTVDGIVAEEPTALGAFSESGLCVGWALPITVNGVSYVSLILYGDDETTDDVDGMLAGEDFSLRIHLIDSETTLEFRQNGTTAFLSGWTNTNGAPIAGYNDPEVTYNFTLLAECSDSTACNYNPASTSDAECQYPAVGYNCDGSCQALDECGVCGGSGILAGNCDCDGNQLDAIGECGGDCAADADADGICDDIATASVPTTSAASATVRRRLRVRMFDIPEGDCDCDGNQLDALGVCGGDCVADADADGM